MIIYFYQIVFLHMYYSKVIQTFMTYYLRGATLNGCIRNLFFFTINLTSLISGDDGEAVLLYHNSYIYIVLLYHSFII